MTDEPTPAPGILGILWESTEALYQRFGVTPDRDNTLARLLEEVGELAKAQADEPGVHVAHEAADVLVTALGVCMSRGLRLTDVIGAVVAVAAKNDAKTHATHRLREDGKIARIEGA